MDFKTLTDNIFDELVKVRRDLHQIPEDAFSEHKTSSYISNYLTKLGIEHKTVASTGIVGLIKGKTPGKTLLIRADMDALPISEENDYEFKSKNEGFMHACGHDIHMTSLLGAAKILNDIKDELSGNIKIVFQPAEETTGGAEPMILEGVLENPKVDAAVAMHVWPDISSGQIELKKGSITASPDEFEIEIRGKGGHAAYPQSTISPIIIGTRVAEALRSIVNTVDPFEPLVVTVTSINAGNCNNVIPEKLKMTGTVRVLSKSLREKLPKLIKDLVEGIVIPMGGECTINYNFRYPPTVNDNLITEDFACSAEKIIGEENVLWAEQASMIGEDFAFFADKVPSTFIRLGSRKPNERAAKPLHNPKFDPDENCIKIACKCILQFSVDFLNN